MRKLFFVTFLVIITMTTLFAYEEVYLKFNIENKNDIEKYSDYIYVDKVIGNTVFAYSSASKLEQMKSKNLKFKQLINPSKRFKVQMSNNPQEIREWDSYPTYDAYIDLMNEFAATYPEICTVESIGSSVEEREILVAKISDNVSQNENEPEFFYTSTMHGDEVVGYILMLHLIDHILQNYGNNADITEMVNKMEIWINPLSNPDGTYASGNDDIWGATRSNANGVDLNRNFPDPEDGMHPDGYEWQPETIAMMDFADERHFTLCANLHSGTEVLNYPWDTWEREHADNDWYIDISRKYADSAQANSPDDYMNEFNDGITNGYDWYSISGGRQDYMNFFQHSRELTMELSDEKLLPEDLLDDHWNYNKISLLEYMSHPLSGLHGTVTNSGGNPLNTEIRLINHDFDESQVYSDPVDGSFFRMAEDGTYDVEVSAFGYEDQIFNNIEISTNVITELNVELVESGFAYNGIVLENSNPVENAKVDFNNQNIPIVYTDNEGEFHLDVMESGEYNLEITKTGYVPLTEIISIDPENNYHEFELNQPSFYEDFENGLDDWTCEASWGLEEIDAEMGNVLSDSPNSDYENETNAAAILETPLDLTDSPFAFLYAKIKYVLETDYDFAYLEIYADNNWQTIDEFNGNSDWNFYQYNLEQYLGQTIQLRFRIETDYSVTRDGLKIAQIMLDNEENVQTGNSPEGRPKVKLFQNYPNPLYKTTDNKELTTISFSLAEKAKASIDVYNIKGQKVKTFNKGLSKAGSHSLQWDGTNKNGKTVSSGIYFYELRTDNQTRAVKKMIIIR